MPEAIILGSENDETWAPPTSFDLRPSTSYLRPPTCINVRLSYC